MAQDLSYPVHKGYLTKSPPDTRLTGKMKSWRRRFFVLRSNKNLQYYEEKGGEKRLLKTIDLSLCTCLDANLYHKRFDNIFSIRIEGKLSDGKQVDRTYFLVADSPYEMKLWTEQICKICEFHETIRSTSGPVTSSDQCPLNNPEQISRRGGTRDSGIHVSPSENNSTSDLATVYPPQQPVYDYVPSPRPVVADRPIRTNDDTDDDCNEAPQCSLPPARPTQSNCDVLPPPGLTSPRKLDVLQGRSCPLDSSSSETNISGSPKRLSDGSQSNYDVPPPYHASTVYDDVPPPVSAIHAIPKDSGRRRSLPDDSLTYDTPPTHVELTYDVPPHTATSTSHHSLTTSSTLPSKAGVTGIDPYDHVRRDASHAGGHYRSPNPSHASYDTVPRPVGKSPRNSGADNYDHVPPPKPVAQGSKYDVNPEDHYDVVAPPIAAAPKPSTQNKYVNLTFPLNDFEGYNKPLPLPPGVSDKFQRDSGTVADFAPEDVYDVPTKHNTLLPQATSVPSVNRLNKPGGPSAPQIDRSSKPERSKSGNYVNLPRSSTFRDEGEQSPRVAKVQRSKSAAGDAPADSGYLYMESPKRTESSLRFSKKENFLETPVEEEGDESYEYMEPQRSGSDTYQNVRPPDPGPVKPTTETSPEKQLKGHYQDIDIVCQRGPPSVPERHARTNYTTIDLEKTKGFRKTCEDVGKNQ